MTALELLACVALSIVSAWLSASEIALFSLSRFHLRSLKERFRSTHRKIKRLLMDPGGLLVTLLVVNELVNVGLSSIIAKSIARSPKPQFLENLHAPGWVVDTVLGLLVATPIVLLLCDITPKVVGSHTNRLFAPMTAGPLTLLYDVFKPIRMVLTTIVARVADWTTPREGREEQRVHHAVAPHEEGSDQKLLRESDFLLMVEEGHREGSVQQSELDLIKGVFELDDTTVAEIFTPLPQVQTLTDRTLLRSALNMMRAQKHPRIPVTATGGSPGKRHVVGILYSKDLLRARLEPSLMNMTVDALMRKPLFVSPSTRLNTLFRKFKQQKTHMAVVQGHTGEALGIVTMSDVIEELFEDLLPDDEGGAD
jgi:CBS domain containing-hemolysin-like protein